LHFTPSGQIANIQQVAKWEPEKELKRRFGAEKSRADCRAMAIATIGDNTIDAVFNSFRTFVQNLTP